MAYTIERLQTVDPALAVELNPLFDEGVEWDQTEGAGFLKHPDTLFLLARSNGAPCGFLTAHRLPRFDRRRAEVLIYEISVDDSHHRRGIGTALIAEVRRWADEIGADETWVLAEGDDGRAQAFYRGTGGDEDKAGAVMFTYYSRDPGAD